ncbi:MAG: aspartate/glutamate racemase family protein [Eubacteriales bacterium]
MYLLLASDIAVNIENAGADYIVICTNTMHKVVPQISERIGIPIIHIAEATTKAIKRQRLKKIVLLGTKYTMTQDFYKKK